jgi:hypothetical protein
MALGQNGLFIRFCHGIFAWLEALARKNRGPCEVWEFLVDFL